LEGAVVGGALVVAGGVGFLGPGAVDGQVHHEPGRSGAEQGAGPGAAAVLPDLEPAALHVQREDLDREDQAMGWLRAEHQVLMRMISYAASEGFGSHAWQPPGF